MCSDNQEYKDRMENWPRSALNIFPQNFLLRRLDPMHMAADKQI